MGFLRQAYLTRPMIKRVYVAASSQHVGKTTSTLGLMAAIREKGIDVGYCKPVGQRYVIVEGGEKVDKDAVLFAGMMDFPLEPHLHSPVIISEGVTTEYIEDKSRFHFHDKIEKARTILEDRHEFMIYEGTGHPGVGTVIDLSNADVAALLNAPVILIVEGGIGKTIDRIAADLALFREKKVRCIGVIINKVRIEKLDKVLYFVGKKLKEYDLRVLGALPYQQSLSSPILENICEEVGGSPIIFEENMSNRVEGIISGALAERKEFPGKQNLLLVVNYRRLQNALRSIRELAKRENLPDSPLSGIIVHGEGNYIQEAYHLFKDHRYINQHRIPVIATSLDTYGSAVRIHNLAVKINSRTPWKVEQAIKLIKENLDLGPLLDFQ